MDPQAFPLARRAARHGGPVVFFDGVPEAARTDAERALRRVSFVAARPSAVLAVRDGVAWRREAEGAWTRLDVEPWAALRAFLPRGACEADTPFPWGVAGVLSYDAGRLVERLPSHAVDDTRLPQMLFFRFDAAWTVPAGGAPRLHHAPGASATAEALRALARASDGPADGEVAPVRARTSPKEFEAMVLRAQEAIRAGEVFQVNLSHRLETRTTLAPIDLYGRLREANPAPFSAFLQSGPLPWDEEGFAILSSSPERLFRLDAGRLEARPIAGTRPRGADAARDAALAAELRADGKEQAEHVMMVDLARNDLGRVARFGSVRVPHLLTVESYRTVHHLVSVVEADLAPGRDPVDALQALFPGGTITGAPKVRAMELIEEIEPVRRGAYTGSLGWIGPDGSCDFNILIRTLLQQRGEVHLQVGAGIVEESDARREHEETLAKAKGLLRALGADA